MVDHRLNNNKASQWSVPLADLNAILSRSDHLLAKLAGRHVLMTGATGFFGIWLLEAIAHANRESGRAPICVTALTRQPEAFVSRYPAIARLDAITLHAGDIRTFTDPVGDFSHIIHGATTSARETFDDQDALVKFDTVAGGTRRLLTFAAGAKPETVLYLGSGACYGQQPASMTHIPESYPGAPSPTQANSALGIGKRTAEFFAAYYSQQFDLDIRVARCFTFYGPHLPVDIHYAIGNFVRDGLAGRDIVLTGDGSPERSYLYVADLVSWLLALLLEGPSCGVYNVGNDQAMTIRQLAETVARQFGVGVQAAPFAGGDVNRYVPDVNLARDTFGLNAWTDFETGITRMSEHVRDFPQYYGAVQSKD